MKKLILILILILICLCVVACIQMGPTTHPEQTQPSSTGVPNTTNTPTSEPPTTTAPQPSEPPVTTAPMADGWQEVDGKRYYYLDGKPLTGWLELDDVRYYFKEDGTMARGCVQIDGVNNYFTSTGAYILVLNPWNSMPEGYEPDLKELSSAYATSNRKVDSSCYEALKKMIKACSKASGHEMCVVSGYRSVKSQQKLFNNQVQRNLNAGYSQEEAERLAAQVVAVPGTSEHHSGLAVDIIDSCCSWELEEIQEDLVGQQWLMEHSWEYGFILRYPKDKIEVTGIIYEPWHYRYVGKELAKELHDLDLTLEEYLDMLTAQENA